MIKYIGKCLLLDVGEQLQPLKKVLGVKKKEKVLVIGDLHLGYEESLNKSGVLISRKMFEELLKDLDEIFSVVGEVDKIVLLGDVKHDFGEINRQEWSDVIKLFEYLEDRCKDIVIIKGNHDNMLQGIAKQRDIEVKDYFILENMAFLHGDKDFPGIYDKKIKYWIVGHAHPAVKLSDGVKVEKYKCFLSGRYKGKKVIIVPSFFEYSAGSDFRENDLNLAWPFNVDKFEVGVVGEDLKVLDFGKLGKL